MNNKKQMQQEVAAGKQELREMVRDLNREVSDYNSMVRAFNRQTTKRGYKRAKFTFQEVTVGLGGPGPGSVVLRCSCKNFVRSFSRSLNAMARVSKQNAARREHLQSLNGSSVAKTEKPKQHFYNVGVRKDYFPHEIWPPAKEMTAWFASFKVLATSRDDAAQKVWAKEGVALRAQMLPDRKKITLEVSDPVRKIFAGRLGPVTVYCEHIFNENDVCRFCRQQKELMK